MIHFTGTKRDGTAATGVSDLSALELTKQLYHKGYRSASLRADDGREVGHVGRNHCGLRSWWAEDPDAKWSD